MHFVHLVTHTAYSKREIKITSNVLARLKKTGSAVAAEQESAVLGRENLGLWLEQG